jgi:hypothetical protein
VFEEQLTPDGARLVLLGSLLERLPSKVDLDESLVRLSSRYVEPREFETALADSARALIEFGPSEVLLEQLSGFGMTIERTQQLCSESTQLLRPVVLPLCDRNRFC